VPFGKIKEKFRKKEKSMLFACSMRFFHRALFSPCCAISRHVLASSCDLHFGSGWTIANLHSLIANPCCHIVCLPIAPHILLSTQVHLATVTDAQQQIASPCLVSSKLPKKFKKIKKKNCQSFCTLFRERAVFLQTTSHLSCRCQFFWLYLFLSLFRENYKKNSEKIKKFDCYKCLLEKSGKNSGKRKNPCYLLVLCVLSIVLYFHLVALRLDTS
jgi:hypothetical protein